MENAISILFPFPTYPVPLEDVPGQKAVAEGAKEYSTQGSDWPRRLPAIEKLHGTPLLLFPLKMIKYIWI
jgi:hypothetical protein